ncbi:signal peptidase II [Candidatus Saganbacteria bacterium CG08_land_8_20_14_0_20_45_16]|uniref:Lipoprotein signal peptidase n=1 Tax=Candidatus Saganbacteria bacterium CG08_land_8_20_14_0_20_45_16 TaxID=2014293 RepID=A0A2H0Y443_UNCSA|nr:MAG: signal peptidase II [Candidatus Saganbacteria bacterium CG08_land_8_20_14_0_20_45_16]
MLFYLLALVILVFDQIFKYLVYHLMYFGQSVPLYSNFLKLTYVRNTGAAFSLFVGFSSYLIVVGVIVVLAVIYFHHRLSPRNYWMQVALAFVLGGSLGNLLDRIFRFYVIDYIDITIWPVFNFADIIINVGVIMIVLKLFEKEASEVHEINEEERFIKGLEHVSDLD